MPRGHFSALEDHGLTEKNHPGRESSRQLLHPFTIGLDHLDGFLVASGGAGWIGPWG